MALVSSLIGYDLDGVLCDTMPCFVQHWKEKYDWVIEDTDNRQFEMPMPPGYNFKDIHQDIIDAINTFQPYMYPHAYALEIVREIGNKLNQVPIIITARHPENEEITRRWLNHWLAYPFDLVLTGNKNKADAVAECEGMLYFVEDRYKTAHQISHVCEKVYMPRRVWNQGRELTQSNIIPISNLIEVYNDILGSGSEDTDSDSGDSSDS